MKTDRIARARWPLAFAVLIFGAQLAAAQHAQLSRIGSGLAVDGFRPTHEVEAGALDDGQETSFSVWLEPGTTYVLRGTCDRDCSDLDLELTRNGRIVDSDVALDDVPEVWARPARAGWYHVRVIMAACSIEPCGYAVGTFGR